MLIEKHNLELQRLKEEAIIKKQIEEATDEKVKRSLVEKQDQFRLKMKERMNETNIQRNVQRHPVRIIVLKNVIQIGSAGLGILGLIPGTVEIGFKIAATVSGIFSNMFNCMYG